VGGSDRVFAMRVEISSAARLRTDDISVTGDMAIAAAGGSTMTEPRAEQDGWGYRKRKMDERVVKCDPAADSTAVLVDALNRSHAAVTLVAGRTCVSEPLVLTGVQNLTITLEEGAELQAKRGSQLFGHLLRLEGATAVIIQGAPTTRRLSTHDGPVDPYALSATDLARPTLRMWREDYSNLSRYAHSEHRHCFSVRHGSQVTLQNLRLTGSGGDGIYVESTASSVFDSLTVDHHFRQGTSIIQATGLLVKDSVFAFTRGTAPMAGIDFEPNSARQEISAVKFQSCRVLRNAGAGVQFSLHAYSKKSHAVDILFNNTLIVGPLSPCTQYQSDCYTKKPYYRWGILVEAWSPTLPPGKIHFNNATVVDALGWSSPSVWVEKSGAPNSLTVSFTNLTVNMSRGSAAIAVSAILPVSGGVSVNGAVINRQCCPGGGPFLTADNSGAKQMVDVHVSDVRVNLASSDNKSQAATACNYTLSANAASNDVSVSNVTCVIEPKSVRATPFKGDDDPPPLVGPIPHLPPRKPYRAWAFHAASTQEPWRNLPQELYPGANLDLTPGGNISEMQDENRRGISVLHWAYGPDSPWVCRGPDLCNQTAAAEYFKGYTSPLVPSTNGTWASAGAAIDEWNPSASKPGQPPSTFTNNSAAAAAGYTMGKKEWPWAFTAGWVTGQDAMFTSLMLEGSFDLAIVEGYSFNPESGGACGKACFLSRLAYARSAGYIHKTINCYGMTVPKTTQNPGGFTVESMCQLINETQQLFPEMPGLAFYGHNPPYTGLANQTDMATLLSGISACAEAMYPNSWTPPPRIKSDDRGLEATADGSPLAVNSNDNSVDSSNLAAAVADQLTAAAAPAANFVTVNVLRD
jgi:hypothetical protein